MATKKKDVAAESKCVDTECAVAIEHQAHVGTPVPSSRAERADASFVTLSLGGAADLLNELQHSRPGFSVHYHNARDLILKAKALIEQQSDEDSKVG